MLKKYQKYLETKAIPYYWNKKFNLLADINKVRLQNDANRTKIILDKIEKNLNDPHIIKAYLRKLFSNELKSQL